MKFKDLIQNSKTIILKQDSGHRKILYSTNQVEFGRIEVVEQNLLVKLLRLIFLKGRPTKLVLVDSERRTHYQMHFPVRLFRQKIIVTRPNGSEIGQVSNSFLPKNYKIHRSHGPQMEAKDQFQFGKEVGIFEGREKAGDILEAPITKGNGSIRYMDFLINYDNPDLRLEDRILIIAVAVLHDLPRRKTIIVGKR